MELVHLGHSCVVLDTGSARILIDPGTFSSGYETLEGLDAVLVTHQHPDHLDLEKLPALLARNPGAELVVDPGTASVLRERDVTPTVREPGERFVVGGAQVDVLGGEHAIIHPDIPRIGNNGYLVDGSVLHPGDALVPPPTTPDVLLLPTAAPWMKLAEVVDFLRTVGPALAVPIHQGILTEPAVGIYTGQFANLAPAGTEVRVAPHGVSFSPG